MRRPHSFHEIPMLTVLFDDEFTKNGYYKFVASIVYGNVLKLTSLVFLQICRLCCVHNANKINVVSIFVK
jgi:hypothetical protein